MASVDTTLIDKWTAFMNDEAASDYEQATRQLRSAFTETLPKELPADRLFADAEATFSGGELAEVCAEIALTVHAGCRADDFHNWDYDHLEFIIDMSNRYDFEIPANFLNGLPEQLILLVKSKRVKKPGCEDE